MSALFPPWSDGALRASIVVFSFCAASVPVTLMAWVRSPLSTGQGRTMQQPLQFDHRHHVQDDGIDCKYCHYDAWRSSAAGVADSATCMGCHRQVRSSAPQLAPLRSSWKNGQPLAWRRVHDLPDFVFFEHQSHVRAGVGCETCHGRVDQMAAVRQVETLTMGWCLDCHRNAQPHLRPVEAVTQMGFEGRGISRRPVDPPLHCSGCHR